MPQISKQQIEQVIASLHCDAEETKLDEVAKMMKSLLDQPEVESVGIVVSSSHQQVQWAAGIDVKALDGTKLYIHPPAPRKPITAEDVTDEVAIEYFKDYPYMQAEPDALLCAKRLIATAVNVYRLEKL
jgi:hypothetical protein